MNIGYSNMTDREYDKAPKLYQFLHFHYLLYLDDEGKIVGGHYYWDSDQIDLLWVPLRPYQGGKKGNKEGNPHLDVNEVLALWRESVPEQYRRDWHNIDSASEGIPEKRQEAEVELAGDRPTAYEQERNQVVVTNQD